MKFIPPPRTPGACAVHSVYQGGMSPHLPERAALRALLLKHSVKIAPPEGPLFNLASGGMSRFYIDVKKTSLRADAQQALGLCLVDAAFTFDVMAAYAGVALGGCHLASLAAVYSLVSNHCHDVIHVRKQAKEHGTKQLVECADLPSGTKVVLFEDVITTGGSSMKAIAELEAKGFQVRGIVAVVDRREDPTDNLEGYPLKAIFTLKDFLD